MLGRVLGRGQRVHRGVGGHHCTYIHTYIHTLVQWWHPGEVANRVEIEGHYRIYHPCVLCFFTTCSFIVLLYTSIPFVSWAGEGLRKLVVAFCQLSRRQVAVTSADCY